MNFIEMDIEEILLLGIDSFYLNHVNNSDVVETCKVKDSILYYYNSTDDEYEMWGDGEAYKNIPELLAASNITYKTFIKNEE